MADMSLECNLGLGGKLPLLEVGEGWGMDPRRTTFVQGIPSHHADLHAHCSGAGRWETSLCLSFLLC